ncbi:class I SAM-dependent methyltransferase [Oleiagrimonas soli]|uniref:Methyltransferase type 12 n=1 Tax=Oleiagrimonas soli TaxID=1543381 RepID=A0A099CV31_9GAMM|nr:methyltransferase domain-containing protein [Oleiagrimonas soli]KGI77501.1 methyltransferase type 12 [Oleiagrimonas soli]MBB6183035.1 putative nicotinamide N-methyase [Oleiagrimonas soli]
MSGYLTRELQVELGGHAYRLQALKDLQQYDDPDQVAERAGISSAQWSLFGHLWPAGRVLADHMCAFEIDGKRILELGCGLGLSSLVLSRRGADITASDYHPLAAEFLDINSRGNRLPDIAFHALDWPVPAPELGLFDVIIGSDILYEAQHVPQLAEVLARHAKPCAEIVITDPGRGNANRLSRMLIEQGYALEVQRMGFEPNETAPYRGRLMTWRRY